MAEPTPYNLTDAVQANGFVDFYQMLGVSSTASADEVRQRINALYSEAQANRDHRNLNKRRDYQSLLEYLPQARTALLDDDKRARYDEYATQAQSGTPATNFSSFMGALSGTVADEDRTDVLGVKDGGGPRVATRPTATTAPTPPRPRQTQVNTGARQSLMGSAIAVIVFVIAFVVLLLLLKNWGIALLIAAIAGAATWFVTHAGKNKIAR